MTSSPEIVVSTGIPVKEVPVHQDLKARLRTFLPNLTPRDASFLKFILQMERRKTPSQQYTDLLTSVVDLLEDNPERAKKLTEERRAAQRVDMMELMAPFNGRERRIIARNLVAIQMTDGCTVGCPWCGAEAKRGVSKAFSLESFQEFMKRYGKYLPKRVILFSDSDPFDWISANGKDDYLHLAHLFFEHTKNRRLITNTSAPEGSELSIIRFLIFFTQRIKEKVKGREKVDVGFSFSQTRNNRKRIAQIMQVLRSFGISDKFLRETIKIIDREPDENEGLEGTTIVSPVRNIGFFINRSTRNEDGPDMIGLACMDDLTISPPSIKIVRGRTIEIGGVVGESMEVVTQENSLGIRKTKISPGQLEIPSRLWDDDYSWPLGRRANSFFSMLPKHTYRIYQDGKFVEVRVIESVRRDALSFAYALANLQGLSNMFLSSDGKEHFRKQPRQVRRIVRAIEEKFRPEFEERKRSCLVLLPQESDEQATRVALNLIGRIEEWLANIDTHLGIKTAEFYLQS